ncbi:hypothetical protein D3C79_792240 [compost metagenome]
MPRSFLLDERGEGLVELRVVLHIDALMRQFVEDQRGQALITPADHRRQDRVVEPAKRRIRLDAAHIDIHARLAHHRRRAAGRALLVIAAVGDATGNRETVRHRLQRELRRSKHIPHHIGPPKVGIHPIATVVRQAQSFAGEQPRLLGVLQTGPQLRAGGRVGEYPLHWLTRTQQLPLAIGQLAVIGKAAATTEQKGAQHGNQSAENAVEWPRA